MDKVGLRMTGQQVRSRPIEQDRLRKAWKDATRFLVDGQGHGWAVFVEDPPPIWFGRGPSGNLLGSYSSAGEAKLAVEQDIADVRNLILTRSSKAMQSIEIEAEVAVERLDDGEGDVKLWIVRISNRETVELISTEDGVRSRQIYDIEGNLLDSNGDDAPIPFWEPSKP